MHIFKAALISLAFVLWSGVAGAHDVEAGKAFFEANCADCHYEDDFAGESVETITEAVQGVYSGATEHDPSLSGFSAEDMANVAAFWASYEE